MAARSHFAILWSRKWLILFATVVASGVAVGLTLRKEPTYAASTTLHVATRANIGDDRIRPDDIVYIDRLENTYAELAESPAVLNTLTSRLNLQEPPNVDMKSVPSTELMEMKVETDSRDTATAAANALAELLIARVRTLAGTNVGAETELAKRIKQLGDVLAARRKAYVALAASSGQGDGSSGRLVALRQTIALAQTRWVSLQERLDGIRLAREERANSLSVVQPALPPAEESKPPLLWTLGIALFVGAVLGAGLAYVGERLRPRVRGARELEATAGVPILGRIPSLKRNGQLLNGGFGEEEAFRRLRLAIVATGQGGISVALLIASAADGDGKTTITANLGRALAHAGLRVLAVDGDLRRPGLHAQFDLPNKFGFSDVLAGRAANELVQRTNTPGLFLLSSGVSDDPGRLVEGVDLLALTRKLKHDFHVVLFDSPSLLAVSDALVFATASDGVVLVIPNSSVPRDELALAQEQLRTVNARLLGLIVNRTRRNPEYASAP